MGRSSSSVGSVAVPSKNPDALDPWEQDGWRGLYDAEGEPLGEGGWGIVRRVRHRQSGELYALKEPLRDDSEVLARLKREIDVQSRVKHRHVMPVLDHDPEFRWFTMPLAERTLHAAAPEMIADTLAIVILQVARGLEAAHAIGCVHRDIKPMNILAILRDDPEFPDWVVGDFGVVRRPEGESTSLKTKNTVGTRGFIAPELWLGKHGNVTPLADIYSLGRTIAWASSGVWPDGIEPLEARWPWRTLVAQMTEFEPDRRPPDMAAVIAGVVSVLKSLRVHRARNWNQQKAPTLSSSEETLLAHVFDHADDPSGNNGDIVVSADELSRHWSTRATLRITLRRLVQLGYLKEERVEGEYTSSRSYSPTQHAWDWATRNESRIAAILKPPSVSPNADDDIPF
jgi:serine/threonine protein kinase